MREIEITAKTVDEAIELALKELDADRRDVEIDVVSEGKPGILGIGAEPAAVRVALLEDQPDNLESSSDSLEFATEVVESLISLMGVEAELNLRQMRDELLDGPVFEIEGEDAGLLIGRKGETLNTLQFLVRYIVSYKLGGRVNLMVDVEGYQERRRQSLSNMALRVAGRVADTGRSISLEPMSPNERRIVHLALSDHPDVVTESDGVGESRQVVIHLR